MPIPLLIMTQRGVWLVSGFKFSLSKFVFVLSSSLYDVFVWCHHLIYYHDHHYFMRTLYHHHFMSILYDVIISFIIMIVLSFYTPWINMFWWRWLSLPLRGQVGRLMFPLLATCSPGGLRQVAPCLFIIMLLLLLPLWFLSIILLLFLPAQLFTNQLRSVRFVHCHVNWSKV